MSVLGALLHAREGAFFKTEQEGELHQYLRRRVKEGKIKLTEEEVKLIQQGVPKVITKSGSVSEDVYEVGMEILQQKSRYNTLDSKSRAEMITNRIKAQMPDASPEQVQRIAMNMAVYGTTGLMAHQPSKVSLSTGRRRALQQLSRESAAHAQEAQRSLSPEATEAMRRQFMAGLRALTYGSLVGIVATCAAITLGANFFGIKDAESLKSNIKATLEPMSARLSGSFGSNLKVSEKASNGIQDSDFAKKIRERFQNFRL
jgi:hypothetical protein